MLKALTIKPFFAGLVLGLIVLSIAGATLRPPHLVNEFKRFHAGINSRNFFATGRELKSIVDTVPTDKIVVIVGGTSVFQGTSQSEQYVWTKYLQEALGDKYRVLNFAQRFGRPNDFGNLAAEMLLKNKRKVIYLCDAMIAQFTIPPEASSYKQVMFDAWRRGYLLNWPPRDKLMRAALYSSNPELREAAWGSIVDLPLNFKDLWNYVSYEIAGTTWNSIYTTASFKPLRNLVDPEPSPDWYKARGYPPNDDPQAMQIVKSQLMPAGDPRWNTVIKAEAEAQFPPQLRAVSVVNVDINSPFYVNRVVPNGRQDYLLQAQHMADLLTSVGFREILIAEKNFDADDFSDRVHLSVSGGMKLASIIAREVQLSAESLGYVE